MKACLNQLDAHFYAFLVRELETWRVGTQRRAMLEGVQYYCGNQEILHRVRTAIGPGGDLEFVHNLPNNRVVDNQFAKMVDQKANYLFGRPATFETDNPRLAGALREIFDRQFWRLLHHVGVDALCSGIAWLHPCYNERGQFGFKRIAPYELLPFWADSGHTELDCAVRLFESEWDDGRVRRTLERVEIFHREGLERFVLDRGRLVPDEVPGIQPYMKKGGVSLDWGTVPLVPFRYNAHELPLLGRVKALQDGINRLLSDWQNQMQEDSRNTILVLKNYDGTDLGEFRHNLSTYGVVKVRTEGGAEGGVETLKMQTDADNFRTVLEALQRGLVQNARGFDPRSEMTTGNPNQMYVQSMYSDLDLDANGMEVEFQAALDEVFGFVKKHLAQSGIGQFEGEKVEVILNRDMLVNEGESIENCKKSMEMLSRASIVAQHPWVTDAQAELERWGQEQGVKTKEMEMEA